MSLAATHSDVKITVGHFPCHVVNLNDTLIKCFLPKDHKVTVVSPGLQWPVNVRAYLTQKHTCECSVNIVMSLVS